MWGFTRSSEWMWEREQKTNWWEWLPGIEDIVDGRREKRREQSVESVIWTWARERVFKGR
jgi:hypothetical protein